MPDLSEFKTHWRAILACFIGVGSALSLNTALLSVMAPYMMKDFGFTSAQWAQAHGGSIVMILCLPLVGTLTDRFGVHRIAPIGILTFPLSLVAMTLFDGSFSTFVVIFVLQTIFGCTTTATVYTRLVAVRFVKWRGLALGLCAASTALFGIFGPPIIAVFAQQYGWRTSMLTIAGISLLCGSIAYMLMPKSDDTGPRKAAPKGAWKGIIGQPVFWVIFIATFLVSLSHPLVSGQLKLVSMAQGLNDVQAASIISIFYSCVIAGRILSGVAIDRLHPHNIAAFFLVLPAFGMMLLVSEYDSYWAVALAIVAMGLAYGGEGDLVGFLVVRHFGVTVFSTVMGLMTAAIVTASAGGSIVLGSLLQSAGGYDRYFQYAIVGVVIGAIMFKLLERFPRLDE